MLIRENEAEEVVFEQPQGTRKKIDQQSSSMTEIWKEIRRKVKI